MICTVTQSVCGSAALLLQSSVEVVQSFVFANKAQIIYIKVVCVIILIIFFLVYLIRLRTKCRCQAAAH